MDGTLKGVNTKGESTLPEWKRGSFSLLFNGGGAGGAGGGAGGAGDAALLYLNRDRKARGVAASRPSAAQRESNAATAHAGGGEPR